MEDTERTQFAVRVAKRIRMMCSHYASAARKVAPPKWVGQIKALRGQSSTCLESPATPPGELGGPEEIHESDALMPSPVALESVASSDLEAFKVTLGEAAEADALPWVVAWNSENFNAYRQRRPTDQPDFAVKIERRDDMADTDPVVAWWSDGFSQAISSMTCRAWRATKIVRAQRELPMATRVVRDQEES